jgi:dihydrofolate reductase
MIEKGVSNPAGPVRISDKDTDRRTPMSRIVTFEILSLDGVYQAPAAPHEDTRDGFAQGGWAAPYSDEAAGRAAAESMSSTGAILLGRRTYEHFATVWPGRTDNPYSQVLDNTQKYVVSTTLTEPLSWRNSALVSTLDGVAELKDTVAKDIVVLGSGELVRSLLARGLVDEMILLIHPIVLGSGRRLFPDDGARADLTLVGSQTTGAGVVIATYRTGS